MSKSISFSMVKPGATRSMHAGEIFSMVEKAGFKILALKKTYLSKERAEEFYGVHKGRPFFGELTEYMSSGPIYAFVVEKDNAVADFRTLIGATNPAEAAEG
ncbi:MAG: nucleoside-diphosphate kinase, partial [Cyclobacteriaceae bacterium]